MTHRFRRVASWLLGAGLAALPLPAQEAGGAGRAPLPILEELDVRVVNVDVVVQDGQGVPVMGLSRGDFSLRVDGREVPIEYFSEVRVAAGGSGGASELADAAREDRTISSQLPMLVVYLDARETRPRRLQTSLEALRVSMGDLLASTRGVMMVRQERNLSVDQGFTRDSERLMGVVERWAGLKRPSALAADRRLLMSRLENAVDPVLALLSEDDEGVLEEAVQLLAEVRIQAQTERLATLRAVQQLRSLVGSVAALPGRKAVLYIGPGFEPMPGEALFRTWWSKYGSVARQLNVTSPEAEMGLDQALPQLTRLLEDAKERQVSFYGHDPGGSRTRGSDAEFSGVAASTFSAQDAYNQQQWVLALARGTGGIGQVHSTELSPLLRRMTDGFRYYYSLGYTPADDRPEAGRLEVAVATDGLEVRHFDRVVARQGSRGLEALTLGALLTETAENPLGVEIQLDPARRQKDDTFVVPLLVKVPIASLMLLPQETAHVGRLSVAVQAQSATGELSPPAQGVVPIEIQNEELLTALGGLAGYRLELRIASGEQIIAIGVRDEVAQRDSALRLSVDPSGRP